MRRKSLYQYSPGNGWYRALYAEFCYVKRRPLGGDRLRFLELRFLKLGMEEMRG